MVLVLKQLVPGIIALPFLATSLNTAVGCSILAVSLAFGLVHLNNSKKHDNYLQVIFCISGGIIYGLLAAQFGLGVSIAAHIANNTFVMTLFQFNDAKEPIIAETNEVSFAKQAC